MIPMAKRLVASLMIGMSLSLAATARGDILTLEGIHCPEVTATVDVNYIQRNTKSTLYIQITNTSSISADLVGFAFNLPTGFTYTAVGGNSGGAGATEIGLTSASDVSPDPNGSAAGSGYGVDFNNNGIDADGLGKFDVGVLNNLTGNYVNDGTGSGPSILNGETRLFRFRIEGLNLSLTTADFLNAFSFGNAPNGSTQFVVRAQDVFGCGSDFLRVVPVPPTLAMVLCGVACLIAGRSRIRSAWKPV